MVSRVPWSACILQIRNLQIAWQELSTTKFHQRWAVVQQQTDLYVGCAQAFWAATLALSFLAVQLLDWLHTIKQTYQFIIWRQGISKKNATDDTEPPRNLIMRPRVEQQKPFDNQICPRLIGRLKLSVLLRRFRNALQYIAASVLKKAVKWAPWVFEREKWASLQIIGKNIPAIQMQLHCYWMS